MAFSRPLAIAIVGMALLAVSITVDVAMNRTYYVDVRDDGAWRTVGQSASAEHGMARPAYVDAPYGSIIVEPNGTLELRLRAENGYPWALSEEYHVIVNGVSAAQGSITAPANGAGESAFTLSAASLLAMGAPTKPVDGSARVSFVYFNVDVDGKAFGANLQVQEAS
jgi:hypothetical protein